MPNRKRSLLSVRITPKTGFLLPSRHSTPSTLFQKSQSFHVVGQTKQEYLHLCAHRSDATQYAAFHIVFHRAENVFNQGAGTAAMAITLFGLCAQRVVPIGSLVNLIFDCIGELLCHLFAVVSFICINDLISLVNQLTDHFRICDIGRGYHHIYDTLAIGVYFVVHLVSDMASVILDSYSGIDYAIERREMLESWLNDPNIPIDHNAVDRAVRPVTIGRKNSLFIGAPEAGQRSAILYTMMEECKRCKVDSLAWLT